MLRQFYLDEKTSLNAQYVGTFPQRKSLYMFQESVFTVRENTAQLWIKMLQECAMLEAIEYQSLKETIPGREPEGSMVIEHFEDVLLASLGFPL